MKFEELKKGNAVSLEVQPRFHTETGIVKGIVLDVTEDSLVIKPVVFDDRVKDRFTKSSIHIIFTYTKKEILSISRTRFPQEVSAALKIYMKQYQEEMKIKKQIQALNRQLHAAEKEKEETFERVTELYFKETKAPETSFVALYLEEQLKKEMDTIIEQKNEQQKEMNASLGAVKEVGKEVVVYLFLHRSYAEISEVSRCYCHYDCECNTNLNIEALFKKYGKRFNVDALHDFTIQQSKDMEIGDKACVDFVNQLELHFNPAKLETTKALGTIVSFMKQYA